MGRACPRDPATNTLSFFRATSPGSGELTWWVGEPGSPRRRQGPALGHLLGAASAAASRASAPLPCAGCSSPGRA